MKIFEMLKDKCEYNENPVVKKLYNIAEDIVNNVKPHLKLISSELPEFDIHDENHSIKVIENIELLLGDSMLDNLSAYELFFIYLSAFLHDAAMALPKWERNLFNLTEGQEGFSHNDIKNPLLYDGKSPMKLSDAREYIISRKDDIYGNYKECEKFIFAFNTEDELINDLSEQLTAYQDYRNGYISELNEVKGDVCSYLKLSDEIRYEYIRENHSIRIEKLVNNLAKTIDRKLEIKVGKKLTKTLASICRSHGESFSFVKELNYDDTYFGEGSVNTQFLCMMLRLGDILHFSYDRAPDSLFAEKMISSRESRKQWKIKSQGVINTIVNCEGVLRVKYDAFCDVPSFYYYLKEYFSWIEDEIANYNRMMKIMNQNVELCKSAPKYMINISDTVDTKGVKYDEDVFRPVDGLCFKLNQSKILELLMGTNLYTNKYLCLREIYQNSLDTCRNMISHNPDYNGYIEFGLGQEMLDGIEKKFLYCLDTGMGMNEHIIHNYFLNIGNSYYKSKDFNRENAKSGKNFTPTSQFGIGMLSCFMLGDKIYISTKHKNDSTFTRFMIDGPYEKFYYVNGNKFDDKENKISEHGTLIKLYLKDDELLNDIVVNYYDFIIFMKDQSKYKSKYGEKKVEEIKNNLLYLMQSFILSSYEKVTLYVKLKDNKLYKLMPINEYTVDLHEFLVSEEILELLSDSHYDNKSKEELEEELEINRDNISILNILSCYKGIEYKNKIVLPKKKIDSKLLSIYNQCNSSINILVDGIIVEDADNILREFKLGNKSYTGIINFTGSLRPQLSVDRKSITNKNDNIKESLLSLRKSVAEELIKLVKNHIINCKLEFNSCVAKDIWSYVFKKYSWLIDELIIGITLNNDIQVYIDEIDEISIKPTSIKELIECEEYSYKINNLYQLTTIPKYIIMHKIINSSFVSVNDDIVTLKNCKFNNNIDLKDGWWNQDRNIIKADEYTGKYMEYDFVKNLYPLVKMETYRNVVRHDVEEFLGKIKISSFYSTLSILRYVDARTVFPGSGVFTSRRGFSSIGRKEQYLRISTSEFFVDNSYRNNKDYFIYIYIAPAKLKQSEKDELEKYRVIDEVYYNGVKNGWSVLFLGSTGEVIIAPEIVTKREILKKISPTFWTINKDVKYYFLDGSYITKEFIDKMC